jgi:hypothetical protein
MDAATILPDEPAIAKCSNGAAGTRRCGLQEWLVIFLARWHHFAKRVPFGTAPQPGRLDIKLTSAQSLSSIPRIAYALLRSALLATSAAEATSDYAAALRVCWASLGPDSLLRAIHPLLVAFDDPESHSHTREPLSRTAFAHGGGRVLLLDAYHVIIVLYRAAALHELPFPPSAGSELRALVRSLAAARGIVPEVRTLL